MTPLMHKKHRGILIDGDAYYLWLVFGFEEECERYDVDKYHAHVTTNTSCAFRSLVDMNSLTVLPNV